MTAPIVVLGSSGQVGRALLKELGAEAIGLARPQADLTKVEQTLQALNQISNPAVLINASAYTQVDAAESDFQNAELVNGRAPGELAEWAKSKGIPFIHYSTDYVFPGTGNRGWTEEDAVAPLNKYGLTKLLGERLVEKAGGKFLIFRTSWVYDADGKNFLNTMLRLGAQKESLGVVADQIGAPTFAGELAQATLKALGAAQKLPHFPSGIYHLTNSGETSWHGFASAIFEQARKRGAELKVREVRPIPAADYPTPAARPSNSRMSGAKFRSTFGFSMKPWQEALSECMAEKYP